MSYFKKLIGKKCYLSPVKPDDAGIYAQWFNDAEVSVNLTLLARQITLENEKDVLNQNSKEGAYVFSIITMDEDLLIGNCSLMNVDLINCTAEIAIAIGNKNFWGLGYGEEAIKLLLDFACNVLHLHNISLSVYDFNKRAIACYLKCGFKEIGRKREAKFMAGQFYDLVLMDILSDECESVYLKKVCERCLTV